MVNIGKYTSPMDPMRMEQLALLRIQPFCSRPMSSADLTLPLLQVGLFGTWFLELRGLERVNKSYELIQRMEELPVSVKLIQHECSFTMKAFFVRWIFDWKNQS